MAKHTIIRIAGALILALITYAAATLLNKDTRLIVGIIIGLPAIIMLITSRVHLGKSFAVKPVAKALVTSGVYSKIQHPLFFFLDILLLAIITITGMPVFLLIWAVLVAVHLWTINKEEKILASAFGNKYNEYREKTWF
jgi:protein-S-isoprenylcysteine O-methyltransferase Ste14